MSVGADVLLAALSSDAEPESADEQQKRRLGLAFWLAAGWMILVTLLMITAPLITEGHSPWGLEILPDPNRGVAGGADTVSKARLFTPGHPLGTDALGRDILSRTIWGTRVSIPVGLSAVAFGLVVGGVIGLVAGYYRGRLESALMGAMDVMLAFPALVLALAIVTFTDRQDLLIISLSIGLVSIAPLARLIRAQTLAYSTRDFVTAAKTLGAKNSRIIVREIVPNVARAAITFAILGIAVAIVAEGFLAFLGMSVRPPTATWGEMINAGRSDLESAPWITMVPATALFLTVTALNFASDRLRAYFDIKEGGL